MGSAIGRRVQMFLEKGELAPDGMVLEFMEQRLQSELAGPGFMLDGFPRTPGQAKALDEWLAERCAPIEIVILFDCREPVILDRVTGRRACSQCGAGYHVRNRPPRVEGRCDQCQSRIIQRDDDTETVLRRRLAIYSEQTEPLVEYFRTRQKLKVVDASQPAEATYASAVEALKA